MTAKLEARPQPMPMARAILWNPTGEGSRHSGRAPYPIFFQQEAVVALQDHLKASPQQAIFGFLLGDVWRDPETGVLYAVIDKTLRLNQAIYGDKTEVVVARLWDRMQEQLARASGRLLGWYHSHPGQPLGLSPHDVETHEKYFTDPWHVAIVVAAQPEGVVGGFFRAGSAAAWVETPLPFYELLQPDSIRADGKKRSFITWKNYKAYNPVAPKRAPAAAAPPPTPPAPPPPSPPPPPPPPPPPAPSPPRRPSPVDDLPIIKTGFEDEPPKTRPAAPVFVPDRAPEPPPRPLVFEPIAPPERQPPPPPPPPAPPPPRHTPPRGAPAREPRRTPAPSFRLLEQRAPRRSRRGRWLAVFAVLLIVAGGAAAGYWYVFLRQPGEPLPFGLGGLVSPRRPAPVAPAAPARRPTATPRPVDTTFARFDRLSDTLSRAVRNYQDRAALFANRQIDCAALVRGLVAIERLWEVYNVERQSVVGALDPQRSGRDQRIYAGVDSVESQFERSRCTRP